MSLDGTTMSHPEDFMRLALELARRGRGSTSPNPMVGAVVVCDGRVAGRGWHERAGSPHAEINAIADAGGDARGAQLYVTLEPCSRQGRTPPCTDAIIAAGIGRVIAAMPDPNPREQGRGAEVLRRAGIVVETGLLEEEARELNEPYAHWIVTGRPLVTIKMALSLDGRMATRLGDSRWITGVHARRRVHELRRSSDAVMVGAGTVLADDPLLTVRLEGHDGPQPLRVILDGRLRTPAGSRMLRERGGGAVLIGTLDDAPPAAAAALEVAGAEVLRLPAAGGRIDLSALMAELGSRGILSVLLEGGPILLTAALEAGLVDRVAAFIAPVIIGGRDARSPVGGEGISRMAEACRLLDVRVEVLGDDVLIAGRLPRSNPSLTLARP